MSVKRYEYFRWTRRTAWLSFVYIAAIPGLAFWYGNKVEVSRIYRSTFRHVQENKGNYPGVGSGVFGMA